MEEFKRKQDLFNILAGNNWKTTPADLQIQCEFIAEELDETFKALRNLDLVEVLDGCCDVLFTAFGLMQRLELLGFDVRKALHKVADNNLTKFCTSIDEVEKSIEYYKQQGVEVLAYEHGTFDALSGDSKQYYVLQDSKGKVRKSVNYKAVDLIDCLPRGE